MQAVSVKAAPAATNLRRLTLDVRGNGLMRAFERKLLRTLCQWAGGVILALNLVVTASQVEAQGAQQQDLLQQLLRAAGQGTNVGGTGNANPTGGALDAARGAAPTPDAAQRSTAGLDPTQRVIATRYCEDRLDPRDRDALAVLVNFSSVEKDYCRRAGELLLQYGYDTFDGPRTGAALANGAVPETYRLGIGDEIIVTFRGQLATTNRLVVDREGRTLLPNLPPIPAAGRSFGEFQRDLQARVQSAFIGTDAFVSLGQVRSIAVNVLGEVTSPGIHQATGLATVLDALALAGGIKKAGSLRKVTVQRQDGGFTLDIYDILGGRAGNRDLRLYEGDRIIVDVLGGTIAVGGRVARPGIFELAAGAELMTVRAALELGGGPLRQGARVLLRSFDDTGREIVRQVTDLSTPVPRGALVFVEYGEDIRLGTVTLEGAVRVPGSRVRAQSASIAALIGGPDSLLPNAYLPFAVLETTEPATLSRRQFAVNLMNIMGGRQDFTLSDGDRLLILSADDVRFLSSERLQAVLRAPDRQTIPENFGDPLRQAAEAKVTQLEATVARLTADLNNANRQLGLPAAPTPLPVQQGAATSSLPACASLEVVALLVQRTQSTRFSNALQAGMPSNASEQTTRNTSTQNAAVNQQARPAESAQNRCPDMYESNPYLLPFVLEHVVALNGELRVPGAYPAVEGTPVGALVAVAGGVTNDADLARVEFTRGQVVANGPSVTRRALANLLGQEGAAITVGPGDVVRFNPSFTDRDAGPVLLTGEFVRPGYYDITRGERLSEVIARAGGLTAQAYPYGGVFTRERVRKSEQEVLDRAARDLNSTMVAAAARGELQPGALEAMRQLVVQASTTNAIGRVVIEADPTVLQVRPELDVVLEPGDVLYMPKRPSSVLVTGDVLNPGAQQFVAGTSVDSYLRQAGGLQRSADRGRIFVLYPNGVAQPVSTSVWTYNSTVQVPPGSAVVAPKDPAPFGLATVRDITTLIGQIALTAASIAVITR